MALQMSSSTIQMSISESAAMDSVASVQFDSFSSAYPFYSFPSYSSLSLPFFSSFYFSSLSLIYILTFSDFATAFVISFSDYSLLYSILTYIWLLSATGTGSYLHSYFFLVFSIQQSIL